MLSQAPYRRPVHALHRLLSRNVYTLSFRTSRRAATVPHAVLQDCKRPLATSTTAAPSLLPTFAPPAANTHDALARLPCPVCGQTLHLLEMEAHLTSAHRDVPSAHWRALCEERLQLYHTMTGTALQRREDGEGVWERLPTITAQGYQCNWCNRRQQFRSRDDFLRHVIQAHPELELEDVEVRVPAAAASAGARPASQGPRRLRAPNRRLAGVTTVLDNYKPTLEPRQVGISVPRQLDRRATPIEIERPTTPPFTETNFPCELCGKCFTDEFNLLQHLETKHPDGEVAGSAAGPEGSADTDVSAYMRKEATQPSAPGAVYLLCDLCNSSKVYTLPSALFAHIRFKHPAEDAAFHVERLMEKHKTAPQHRCSICLRCFATEASLLTHEASVHGGKRTSTSTTAAAAATAASATPLPPSSAKAPWWCNACERGFISGGALHGHMVDKHNLPLEQHPCPYCKRIFKDAFSLATHVTQGHKELPLEDLHLEIDVHCPTCNRYFLNYDELHTHDVRHHHKDPRRPARSFEASAIVTEALLRRQAVHGAASQQGSEGRVTPRKASNQNRT